MRVLKLTYIVILVILYHGNLRGTDNGDNGNSNLCGGGCAGRQLESIKIF